MKKRRIKYIWGAGGTGKSYSLAKYLVEKEGENSSFNFLITSYTHIGKNEIYKHYLTLKKEDTVFYYDQNFSNCRTFHSIIFNIIKELVKQEENKNKNLFYFLKRKEKENNDESITALARKLFFQDIENKKELFLHNIENLSKVLDIRLDSGSLKRMLEVFQLLEKMEEEEYNFQLEKIKEKLNNLKSQEVVAIILLLEGNLYDYGVIFNPFEQRIVNDKTSYVVLKYKTFYNINIKDELDEAIEYVLSEDFASPLHPTYNMRKIFDFAVKEGYDILENKYDTIIIDEAQDFPEVAFYFIKNFYEYDELILSGDPYQAIFLDLGFNSEFMKLENVTEIKNTLFRYSKEYFYSIKYFFPPNKRILVLDNLLYFMGENKTIFSEKKIEVSGDTKKIYLLAGLEIMKKIKNKLDCVFLTHNLSKFVGLVKNNKMVFLPYKGAVRYDDLPNISTYILGKYLCSKKEVVKSLLDYYKKYLSIFGVISRVKYHPLLEKEEKLKKEISQLLKEKEVSLEKVYDTLKKYPIVFEKLKKRGEKDFVITLTTHRSKGKTIDETIYYLPNKGMYYFLEKYDENYSFIHNMMKYVSLTRARNKLVYVRPISPF